jgi:general secretion pathway protein N
MSRLPWLVLALVATVLATGIVLELGADAPAEDATGIVPLRHAPLARARAPTEDPVDHTDAWVQHILARPLFSKNRRPTPVVARAGGDTVLASLPRLTGVLVGPFGRSAIFASDSGGKPMVIVEGGTLGPYTVQAIEPGRVTVAGPEGVRQLQPSFDANARRVVAETPPPQQAPQRPSVLNVRPGSQFQRALSVIENGRPAQPGNE